MENHEYQSSAPAWASGNLTRAEAGAFRSLFRKALLLYGMTRAELADHRHPLRQTEEERKIWESYSARLATCPCKEVWRRGSSADRHKQTKRILDNALDPNRPLSLGLASALFHLLRRSKKSEAWRKQNPGGADPIWQATIESRWRFTRPLYDPTLIPRAPLLAPAVALTPTGLDALSEEIALIVVVDNTFGLKKRDLSNVRDAIRRGLRKRRSAYHKAFVERVRFLNKRVDIIETTQDAPESDRAVLGDPRLRTETTSMIVRDTDSPGDHATRPTAPYELIEGLLYQEWEQVDQNA